VIDGEEKLLDLETLHELSSSNNSLPSSMPSSGREGDGSDSEGSAA